ncbi:inactive tyrosine-protein kinase 7 isoform X1 [Petromyzon marinus]|uniref:inactive tyrosine-protein kinase 7 isoform X1 n=1 Tax=Petromyzon marinus TaxID=7757 RepID=UPI003F718695
MRLPGVLLLLCVLAGARAAIVFTEEPISQDAQHGRFAILRCEVAEPAGVTFSWLLDGHHLPDTARRFVEGSNLQFSAVDRKLDAGVFVCVVRDPSTGEVARSQDASLNIKWIETGGVTLDDPVSREDIKVSSSIKLHCHIEGHHRPLYQWLRDGVELQADARLVPSRDGSLTLSNVSAADNGAYTCCGQNLMGSMCSVSNFTLDLYDVSVPRLVVRPVDQVVSRNEAAFFHCQFTADPPPTPIWYFNGEPITNKPRTTIFPNGSLLVSQVKQRNVGAYRCVARGARGKEASAEATLALAYIGDLVPLDAVAVQEGASRRVQCGPVPGQPPPAVWWERDGARIGAGRGGGGRVHVTDAGELRLDPARAGDSGTYQCVAENKAGRRQQEVTITVATVPVWVMPPVDSALQEGQPGFLHCSTNATPTPHVAWYKNNFDISVQDGRFEVFPNGTLRINAVEVYDGTVYTCNSSTAAGSITRAARVHVLANLKFTPTPQLHQCLELGKSSSVHCSATGREPPVITWSRQGHGALLPPGVAQEAGTLVFRKVDASHEGDYSCTASNSMQGDIEATVRLQVAVFPYFKMEPENTTVYAGDSAMFHCQALGDPEPSAQWKVRGHILNSNEPINRVELLPNGSLLIRDVRNEDSGWYTCIAGNKCNIKHHDAYLYIVVRPLTVPPTEETQVSPYKMIQTIGLSVGAAVAYIIMVLGLMLYCKKRRKSRSSKKQPSTGEPETEHLNGDPLHENGDAVAELKEEEIALTAGPGKRASLHDRPTVAKQSIQRITLLGKGQFGEVYLAKVAGLTLPAAGGKEDDDDDDDDDDDAAAPAAEAETVAMVKALGSRDERAQAEFQREVDLFGKASHVAVARLLAVCKEPLQMVLEYTDLGDLKQYLKLSRGDDKEIKMKPLTAQQKLSVCVQVAQGMVHLSSQRLVHGDLAARNCLVSSDNSVKISCPGLSRDVYSSEYFEHRQALIPLRWMAPEAVAEGDLSTKSDVWAVGVLLWEVCTLGELPYAKLKDEEVFRAVQSGSLKPLSTKACPAHVSKLLQRCLAPSPRDRPSFPDVLHDLSSVQLDTSV